jgi:hypothetical protein
VLPENGRLRRSLTPETSDLKQVKAFGSVYEYHERFKQILKRYLTMKYSQKKEGLEYGSTRARSTPAEDKSAQAQSNNKIITSIKSILTETAERNGLSMKKAEPIATLIKEQLGLNMERILQKIKQYFEDEIKIKWQEFEPYPAHFTPEQKEQQDWDVFFMSLRNQSMRYILIDKPDFFGDSKMTAYMKEKLL